MPERRAVPVCERPMRDADAEDGIENDDAAEDTAEDAADEERLWADEAEAEAECGGDCDCDRD